VEDGAVSDPDLVEWLPAHLDAIDAATEQRCGCGDRECLHNEVGYPWCRSCREHHRPPECPIDEHGHALAPCGHSWGEALTPGHFDRCNPDRP
jgi:hypothetical protein